ncbi:HSP70-domain-containing protein [Basidiobolus meristosporus CBS 931.73]|uniref:HSP70-domain-containing protein n=1 Tax=Basidiobolus meristosporus CBS 931.73 TaxID=1314790 RepID=A0A1Y1Y157_9FUNG|nr:HSP70-domain-containing protein [Basidiobolus meristosporus CBS 931.73]|eukprot:ORX91737.1 HSP70-domain-containing protein [Basidiobolus meristosporus CBS 931.73]
MGFKQVTLTTALLALAAFMQPISAAIISIDYGTEWFKVGLVKTGTPIDVVLGRDSKRKIQSVVAIRNNERIYGVDGLNLGTRFPKLTYPALKNLVGRLYDDDICQNYHPVRGTASFKHDDGSLYSVEELIAMQLRHAKELAEDTAQEKIKDTILTVPPFFNTFERQALLDAAGIAGLNVLEIINDESAVALNYAMSRTFTEEPEYHIFYDMGAGSTVASLMEFKTISVKDVGKYNKSITQVEVKAVGYDRTLGGHQFDYKLQEHLADEFINKMGSKVKSNIRDSGKAMARLLKEAARVKQILSANTETIASVENLFEEHDFRTHVARAKFETISDDLFARVTNPIASVLNQAGLSKSDISSLVLVGGSVRIPRIQSILKDYIGDNKIAKNVNGDEAAVLGAAFRGAGTSRQFKVREIRLNDITTFPVDVTYYSEPKNGNQNTKQIQTTLFKEFSPLNVKKIMNFKRTSDFQFEVQYGKLKEEYEHGFGPKEIARVHVEGLTEGLKAFDEVAVNQPKVQVSLRVNKSGTLSILKAVATVETSTNLTEEQKKASLKDRMLSFIKGEASEETKEADEKASNDKTVNPDNIASKENGTQFNQTAEEGPKVEKIQLRMKVENLGVKPMDTDAKQAAIARIKVMDDEDAIRRAREESRNKLESFIYSVPDFSRRISEASEWLWENEESGTTKDFQEQYGTLDGLYKPIQNRQKEFSKRGELIKTIQDSMQYARDYVEGTRANMTDIESPTLDKLLKNILEIGDETEKWLNGQIEAQSKIPLYENPVVLVKDLEAKNQEFHLSLIGLVHKVEIAKRQAQKSTTTTATTSTATESTTPNPESESDSYTTPSIVTDAPSASEQPKEAETTSVPAAETKQPDHDEL